MGQAGSDVAKEASDIVLADDNFASIVAAIEEGRRIFDNIQKFVLHVLAENIAQAGTLLFGLVALRGFAQYQHAAKRAGAARSSLLQIMMRDSMVIYL